MNLNGLGFPRELKARSIVSILERNVRTICPASVSQTMKAGAITIHLRVLSPNVAIVIGSRYDFPINIDFGGFFIDDSCFMSLNGFVVLRERWRWRQW